MANRWSEYGEGRGRTGYKRDLKPAEVMRLERAMDPADPTDTMEAALARELKMEKRTRTDEGFSRDRD